MRVPEPKRHKNRLHLDLRSDDLEAEVTRLVDRGAVELSSSIALPDGFQANSDELTPEDVQRIADEYRVEPSREMGVLAPRKGSGERA
jgi:hypothetical protein